MEHLELPDDDDDIAAMIDFDSFFDDLPEATDAFGACSTSASSPSSESSWIAEMENILMKDDDEDDGVPTTETTREFCDMFLADVLVDSPGDGCGEVVDLSLDKEEPGSSHDGDGGSESGKVDVAEDGDDAADDTASKKRRRKLRNRDAATRSRERKKAYVKELEMKKRYLEGECRRLGRLLQCFMAENQALRLSLQNSACGANGAKQESAVLLLEPLPLGSLFWFLCITCLFTLPMLLLLAPGAVLRENVGKKDPISHAPSGAKSEMHGSWALQTFIKSRRCKASRRRMKIEYLFSPVSARVGSFSTPTVVLGC